jgi:hypothetical protein
MGNRLAHGLGRGSHLREWYGEAEGRSIASAPFRGAIGRSP